MKFSELNIGDVFCAGTDASSQSKNVWTKISEGKGLCTRPSLDSSFDLQDDCWFSKDFNVEVLYRLPKLETRMSDIKPGEKFKVFDQEFTMLDTRTIKVSNSYDEKYKYIYVNKFYTLYATKDNEVVTKL